VIEAEPIGEPRERPRRPPVPLAHEAHRRRHEQDSDDRGIDEDGDRHPDADALDRDGVGERE
jgi:hypothetical protein